MLLAGLGLEQGNCLTELIISKKKEPDFRLRTPFLTLKSQKASGCHP